MTPILQLLQLKIRCAMSYIELKPYNKNDADLTKRARERYVLLSNLGKYALLLCGVVFVLAIMYMFWPSPGGSSQSFVRNIMLISALYTALPILTGVAFGVWFWGGYMAKTYSFVDEGKIEPKWFYIINSEKYQNLKKAQGGVYYFQFYKLRE